MRSKKIVILRMILAILVFLLGCYLIYDMVAQGFSWLVLAAVVTSFVVANLLWPKGRKENDAVENSLEFVDVIEILITLPFRAFALFLRTIGRVGKDIDGADF